VGQCRALRCFQDRLMTAMNAVKIANGKRDAGRTAFNRQEVSMQM
jgi:hypothetical protein